MPGGETQVDTREVRARMTFFFVTRASSLKHLRDSVARPAFYCSLPYPLAEETSPQLRAHWPREDAREELDR